MISRTFLIAMILGSTNAFTAVNNHRGIVSRGVQKLNMVRLVCVLEETECVRQLVVVADGGLLSPLIYCCVC